MIQLMEVNMNNFNPETWESIIGTFNVVAVCVMFGIMVLSYYIGNKRYEKAEAKRQSEDPLYR